MDKFLYKRNTGDYNLLMAFPAVESFALASLGYLWLFKIADTFEGINAQRASTDNIPYIENLNAIAFSLSFDFDFAGTFEIMEKLNIPLFAKERNDNYPIIFAGGPAITMNPRPYEAFFDFMLIGDGEENFKQILEILKENNNKQEILKLISEIEGVYFPSNNTKKVSANLKEVIYTPIISDKSYFKNTFIIEISRGCMNRCAFCTASYTNLPYRYYEYEKIIKTIEYGLKETNKIALLGAQISAHPQFREIMKHIRKKIETGSPIELGISSLRTDAVSPDIIKTLVLGGQRHSTIAIEAASERLRKFINKNLSEDQILRAVSVARENGLKGLKVYSMIGIPYENEDDINEFLNLAKKIKAQNKGFNIEFSFSSFVPKPQTPFQREKREDTGTLEKRQKYLEKEFGKIGVAAKFSSIKWDYWQSIISRGGVELAPFLVEVYKNGNKLGSYKAAQKKLNLEFKLSFSPEETLPWEIIEFYPSQNLLKNEYNRLTNRINVNF